MTIENIILFDLDQTLCDYDLALSSSMQLLMSPEERFYEGVPKDDAPQYLRNRANLVRASVEWWAGLPRLQLGFDIWKVAEELGYRRMILTQGPKRNPNAWSGKKIWIDNNLGQDVDITITRDKGLVYGKVLVDDWPEYILRWLEWRPRGLVIMPASRTNADFKHEQVIRYDGSNLEEVRSAMDTVKLRIE
jgi:5'-nucleotidase